MFRKLNEKEQAVVEKLKERGKILRVHKNMLVDYRLVGNFTIAMVKWTEKSDIRIGLCKYNPFDKGLGIPYSEEAGKNIAFWRAVNP